MRKLLTITLLGVAALAAAACGGGSDGSNYPERPINVTVGYSAGGSSDFSTRILTDALEDELDTTIQVTNLEGANGGVAGGQVAEGDAEGYEMLGGASVHGTWPTMDQAEVGWEDFYTFIAGSSPTTIYVAEDSEYETLDDVVSAVEEDPGGVAFGQTGAGGNGDILGRLLLEENGLEGEAESIPYDGGREAAQFLRSGEVEFAGTTLGDATDLAEGGEMRPVANLFEEDIEVGGVEYPTVLDEYPELEPYTSINASYGLSLPRDTPDEVVVRFSEAFAAVMEDDEVVTRLEERGIPVDPAVGQESDEVLARVASARTWPQWELDIAPNNPADQDIPRIEDFEWPPNEQAEEAKPWPDGTEEPNAG